MTHFDDLWASLPIPALTVDPDDRIVHINPAAEAFLNHSAKYLAARPIWDEVIVDRTLDASMDRARALAIPLFVNDVDVGTGAKKPTQCNIQIAPLAGTDLMLMLIEPRELGGRMHRNGHSKSAAKSAIGMAEMLAHEIKNPLAGITGAAQLLSMNLSNGDLEMTDLIVAESRRIVKLLEQVEQFGDVSKPNLKPVNIHDILDRARKSAAVGFGAHMKLVEDYDPSLPQTLADGDQLVQVFLNLLKNASEAADPTGGTIRLHTFYEHSLRLRRKDGTARSLPLQIEVIDDGPGLPAEIASDVFDPFVSGRENGTGLGLALVSKIVSDHDGWINVESVPGRTVFRLSLPVAPTTPKEI
ncbi:MAG: two-component system sensor histidine kinase NtrB [Shimia sp.]